MIAELEILVAGAFTLMIFSFLYKENPAYRLAEHVFVGAATGRAVVLSWEYVAKNAWKPLLQGQSQYAITFILGPMFLFYFSKKYFYLYRYPLALITGMGMGLTLGANVLSWLIRQVRATFVPLFVSGDALTTFSNLFIAIGTICGVSYFILTKEHTGILAVPTKIGIYVLMAAFGAHFGYTVMARVSLLIGRISDLVRYPSYYEIPIAVLLILGFAYYEKVKAKSPV